MLEKLNIEKGTENINLTPEEKKLYEKCLSKNPEMTVMTWKELRINALNTRDTGAKQFYEANNFLVSNDQKPDLDTRKEWASNMN